MYKRKPKSRNSFSLLSSSNRGSDIVKPDNTSLIVNKSESEVDELPNELTSIFSEDDVGLSNRKSASLMKSLSQKTQSTPKESLSNSGRVLRKCNFESNQNFSDTCKVPQGLLKVASQPEKKNNNYFVEVLKDCGAFPNAGNTYLMREDQGIFSLKIKKKLSGDSENLQKFISSLEEEIEDPENFKKMLTHTLTADDCDVARAPVQEPLMRMLLNVDCLQISLFNLLLQKLANIVVDGRIQKEDSQFMSSILCQCRFLNRVKGTEITSKLFEIIHMAPLNIQKEIIYLLPEISTEEEAEETCNQLLDLMKLDKRLTNVVVDAIANLPLSGFVMAQARTKMLCRLDKCSSESLPSLVQFVLNKCDAENLTQIICNLRESLPFTVKHFQMKTVEEKKCSEGERLKEDSYLKLTFENLKFSVMVSREMTDAWIKVIAGINCSAQFGCLDLTMLIIFYSCLVGRKGQVLSLIRNKIKSSILTEVHVQDMFKILLGIAREYFSTILELASVFLKSFEKKISDFGAVLLRECFLHFHFFKKQTVVSVPISEILLHVGTGSPETINTALDIIKNLSENETEVLSRHTVSIMSLLVKIHDLSLVQARVLLDIISKLIFYKSTEETIGWRDELHIFIQKQLSSSKFDHCKKGIVGAIMFGMHAEKKQENEIIDRTQINSLLEMAMGSNRTSQARKSFFNDEFATAVRNSQLNESFLENWNDKVYNIVINNVFVQNIDVECEHFPMCLQYSLHTGDNKKFVFPLVKFVIDSYSSNSLNAPLSVIPSTLRLLWSFKENFKRNLPVFCASVIMPEVSVFDNFDVFNWKQKKIIIDCLFLCANYLIECVNAFCSQEVMDKALLRIRQLVSVRKLIVKCLHQFFDYSPPFCQFYMSVQKVVLKKKKVDKKIKKNRKRKSNDVESDLSNQSTEESQNLGSSSYDSFEISQDWEERNLHMYRGYFREFHIFIYKLLKTDVSLKDLSETTKGNGDSLNKQHHSQINMKKLELDVSEVLFLLEELLYKLEQNLKEYKRSFNLKSKSFNSTVEHITEEDFMAISVEILPKLLADIEILSSFCEKLLEANDWIYDSRGMFVHGTHDVKLALTLALKFISEIISWKGFKNFSNQSLLKDVLTILCRKRCAEENLTIPCLALEAANYLAGFSKNVLTLDGGLSIVKAYEACLQFSSSSQHFSNLGELCFNILSRPWFTVAGAMEKGPTYNQNVDILIKTYFENIDNKLEVVRNTAKRTLSDIEQPLETTSFLRSVKAINKNNFPLLYRAMCESLVSASTAQLEKIQGDTQLSLEIWSTIVDTWLVLIEIVKIYPSRVNLASLLKRSQFLIQLFLSKGMPLVESALRVKSSEILKLLKYLQTVTRFLHSVCCHSKITNDSIIAAHVPAIRSQCERLTLEIKGVLILNKIPMDCITIAILKNRDLKGNDILSQESVDNDSGDDFEFPPEDTSNDDDDDDDGNNDNTITETQESASEVY